MKMLAFYYPDVRILLLSLFTHQLPRRCRFSSEDRNRSDPGAYAFCRLNLPVNSGSFSDKSPEQTPIWQWRLPTAPPTESRGLCNWRIDKSHPRRQSPLPSRWTLKANFCTVLSSRPQTPYKSASSPLWNGRVSSLFAWETARFTDVNPILAI